MTISSFKAVNIKTLIATFNVTLQCGIVVCGVMLHRNGKSEWIAFPGKPYTAGGVTCYSKLIDIPSRQTRDKFKAAVIETLKASGHIQ